MSKNGVLYTIVIFVVVMLTLPTIIIIGASFTSNDIIQFPPSGFSLKWYSKLFEMDEFLDAFYRTLYVSIVCTIISIPAGSLCALALMRYKIRFKKVLQVYLLLPFTIPLVVSGIGMMIFFGEIRILGSLFPVALGLCIINLPFMIWTVSATVNRLDPQLENAGANCGANPIQVFFTITVPSIAPGIITGSLLMFILAFNEFLVSLFLTDARIVTLPVQIYNSIRSVITPDLAAISVVYVIMALITIYVLDKLVGLDIFLKSNQN